MHVSPELLFLVFRLSLYVRSHSITITQYWRIAAPAPDQQLTLIRHTRTIYMAILCHCTVMYVLHPTYYITELLP